MLLFLLSILGLQEHFGSRVRKVGSEILSNLLKTACVVNTGAGAKASSWQPLRWEDEQGNRTETLSSGPDEADPKEQRKLW